MINTQKWLDREYPKNQRENIINLNIKNKELEGDLDLSDFTNLKKLNCAQNKITKLDIRKCNKLKELDCNGNHALAELLLPNNREKLKVLIISCFEGEKSCPVHGCQLPTQNLTLFQEFVNLEKLSIDGTNFYGSLEPLKNLTKLRELDISHTEISEGLEYLSENIESLCCCGGNNSQYQVKKIQNQLELESSKFSINGNEWKNWRKNRLIQLVKEKKELETKLVKQKEISQGIINHLRKKNQESELRIQEYQQQLEVQQNNSQEENFDEILAKKFEKLNIEEEVDEGASIYSFKTSGNLQDRQLDTLARLLTGGETCVAVCYHQERLLIASNKKRPSYAEEYLGNLQRFSNEQNQKNFEKLLELVVKQTSTQKRGVAQSIKANIKFRKDKPKTFRKTIEECRKNPNKPIDFKDLQEAAQRAFNKIIKLKEKGNKTKANQKWSYLTIWQDTGEIIEAIIRENLDKRILEKVKNLNLESDIDYIEFKDKEQNKLHAEMKIIDKLHGEEGEKDNWYIGLNKLSCPNCQAVISILNSESYSWRTYADESHGKEYDGWIAPKIMKGREKEISNWKKANKSQKVKKETTSEIPEKLVNVIQLLRELQAQDQQAQVEQLPYGVPGSSK